MNKTINSFSKLTKQQKIDWLAQNFIQNTSDTEGGDLSFLKIFQLPDANIQRIFDGFSENTIANFPMPYGIAPNFVINNNVFAVPMVIEESSVVAGR